MRGRSHAGRSASVADPLTRHVSGRRPEAGQAESVGRTICRSSAIRQTGQLCRTSSLCPARRSLGLAISAQRFQRSIRIAPSSGPSVHATGNPWAGAATERSGPSLSQPHMVDVNGIRSGILGIRYLAVSQSSIAAAAATSSPLPAARRPSGSAGVSSRPVRMPCPRAIARRLTAQEAMPSP